jgi:cation:H+ antiporter
MTIDLTLSRWQGWLLIAAGVLYFAYDFVRHARDREPADLAEAEAIEADAIRKGRWFHSRSGTAVQFLLGAALVVLGSRWLVSGAVQLAAGLAIPSIIVGLTIVAVGTSLPELVTAISSTRKAVTDLAVGNILGANIANLSLIVGTAAVISDVRMDRFTQLFNFPAMLVVFVAMLWMILTGHRVTRREGAILLVMYVGYITVLVISTLAGPRG